MAHALHCFFVFFTLACALGVVMNKNAVNGAMCLMLCLVGVAGLFVGLGAYLLAFLLLLVYAGAVVALFLFIIMLLDMQGGRRRPFTKMGMVAGLAAGALLLAGLAEFVNRSRSDTAAAHPAPALGSALTPYAHQLFTTYLLPVEVIGFLLLIAMLGVIVLSKKFSDPEDAA